MALRDSVLPLLRRRSLILPAQPRYRLGSAMSAMGGRLFELQARHGAGLVVARIGIGWKEYGAGLVWFASAGKAQAEPARPWVVDVLDPAAVASLNICEAERLARWVPVLARDLAWAAAARTPVVDATKAKPSSTATDRYRSDDESRKAT